MKRHSRDPGVGSVAFNFEDVQIRCEEYKTQVKDECRRLVMEAQQQAEEIRARSATAGQSEGYRNGLAEAEHEIAQRSQQQANELVEERLSTVVPAVSQMLDELVAARSRMRLEWETELVGTAVAIAEKILRKNLQLQPDLAAGVVENAVELAIGSTSMQIQLHPADVESLGDRIRAVVQDSSRGVEVKLIAEPAISRGGCVITTSLGQIDARIETMLERISSELLEGLQ